MTGSRIATELSRIIDSLIEDTLDITTDEIVQEACENQDNRDNATDTLIRIIEAERGDL